VLAPRVLYYGRDEALPERVPLAAGPLTLLYEEGDLRSVKWGGHEVLRRVYVAIRDRNWGTVAPVITNVVMDLQRDHFAITFDVANEEGEVDFAWRGTISGSSEGVLVYEMDGIARSTFMRTRIGFCVLHPAECAGARCRIEHIVGEHCAIPAEEGALPLLIQPFQPLKPFAELAALAHEVEPGVWANVRFDGDIFEMEDQRNWTDASYKTFCTPLRLPYPVEIAEGTRITQRVTLQVVDERTPASLAVGARLEAPSSGRVAFTIDHRRPATALPKLGLGAASTATPEGQPLSDRAAARLRALQLDHLRIDLRLADADLADHLRAGAAEAQALDLPAHVALYVAAGERTAQFERLLSLLQAVPLRVARWLIYPVPERLLGGAPVAEVLAAAHRYLDGVASGAQFAAGTDTDFIFAQRNLPPLDTIDLFTFAINPQSHAFDNVSLVETLATQVTIVQSARSVARGKPVMVSPITFKMRYNAYATAPPAPPSAATARGQLPPNVDARQMSLFGAGWTLGSIAAMAAGGADSATYYETTGWRGVMEQEDGSPLPSKFMSLPGGLFPLYYVLAAIGGSAGAFAGGQVLATSSSDPWQVTGLALVKGRARRVLLANLTAETQHVDVQGVDGQLQVRMMDETNAEALMHDPGALDLTARTVRVEAHECLALELRPFAVAWIDAGE
jgi:D-apionolactonase